MSIKEHLVIFVSLFILFSLLAAPNLLQASGYGSGDDTYGSFEDRDEVKKVVEEREYAMVCEYYQQLSVITEPGAMCSKN